MANTCNFELINDKGESIHTWVNTICFASAAKTEDIHVPEPGVMWADRKLYTPEKGWTLRIYTPVKGNFLNKKEFVEYIKILNESIFKCTYKGIKKSPFKKAMRRNYHIVDVPYGEMTKGILVGTCMAIRYSWEIEFRNIAKSFLTIKKDFEQFTTTQALTLAWYSRETEFVNTNHSLLNTIIGMPELLTEEEILKRNKLKPNNTNSSFTEVLKENKRELYVLGKQGKFNNILEEYEKIIEIA